MKKILSLIISLFCSALMLFSQEPSKWFVYAGGELPSINLSGDNIVSEQFSLGLGFQTLPKLSLFFDLNSGIWGKNPDGDGFVRKMNSWTLGADYLFSLKNDVKIGLEIKTGMGSSGLSDGSESDYDFTIVY